MKKLIFILVFTAPQILIAQKLVTTFDQATQNHGIVFEQLDSLYPSAIHADTAMPAVFRGQEAKFINAYQSMIFALTRFLNENQFSWDQPTRCFNRIYFNKNGEVDYFLFNFKPGVIEKEKEKKFALLVEEFIKTYTFPLKSESNFAQCSPVVYNDLLNENPTEASSTETKADVLPEFPGGRKALAKFIDGKNHHYPKEARQNKIEGKVIVEFYITEDGTPTDFKVVEGIGYGCDEAAVEAFKKMPKWKPAMSNGKAVKYTMRMAYLYRL